MRSHSRIILTVLLSFFGFAGITQNSKKEDLLIGKWAYEKYCVTCEGKTDCNSSGQGKTIIEFNRDSTYQHFLQYPDTLYITKGKWKLEKSQIKFSDYDRKTTLVVSVMLPWKIVSISTKKLIIKTPCVIERCVAGPKKIYIYRDHYQKVN